jgi:hypothetical protein
MDSGSSTIHANRGQPGDADALGAGAAAPIDRKPVRPLQR